MTALQRRGMLKKIVVANPTDPSSCHIWIGCRIKNGYGQMCIDYKTVYVHRYIYEQAHGIKIPKNLQVDHICGNTSCVNVNHLQLLTQQENIKKQWKDTDDFKKKVRELLNVL